MDAVFDIVADDGNTSSRHSKLSYIASGQPISLSCRQTVPEVLWITSSNGVLTGAIRKLFSFHAGHHAKLCSHHFVLNVASQTSVSVEFAPDCSWIQCTQCKCAHFIHDSITLTSSEYDVSSDGALTVDYEACNDSNQCLPVNNAVPVCLCYHISQLMPLLNCVSYGSVVCPCHTGTSDADDEEVSISLLKLFSFHAGHHAKLCSHHFVLNVASQTSVSVEFAPDCSWIQCTQCKCAHFIHDSITLTSSEYDVSSDGALIAVDATLKLRFLRFGCLSLSHRIMNPRPYCTGTYVIAENSKGDVINT
ncbi:hypothetical protein T05_1298 [Trichinella murrelli]|uniref:Uncharacterized protein n=1 Tax=Trichinella murrelli TaxID=144512 RepID=A0A0V0TKT7_9BILA|nr:hypothetical protein T05_1298 [Trichinella murrelli]